MILFAYQVLYPLIAVGILIRIFFMGRGKALREGWPELRQRLGRPSAADLAGLSSREVVWLHAASVGEVVAAEPLVRLVAGLDFKPAVLMTTSTVAGRHRAGKIEGVDAAVLLPMDFYPAVNTFLDRIQPRCLILMEKEFWPYLLRASLSRGIRIGVANGRLTARSTRRYGWIGSLLRSSLEKIGRAAVQTEKDADRFRTLGVPAEAVMATGNMKYDLPLPSKESLDTVSKKLTDLGWTKDPIWIAGSTRRGEEEIILEAQAQAAGKADRLRLILAPRHIERTEEVAALLRSRGLKFVRWSQLLPFQSEPDCLLIDVMGVLGSLYSAAWVAYVGGTMVPVGGHNLLEPALQSCPVLFGPHTGNTQAVADALLATGGATLVSSAEELSESLSPLLESESERTATGEKALKTAESFTGATRRTFEHIRPILLP